MKFHCRTGLELSARKYSLEYMKRGFIEASFFFNA